MARNTRTTQPFQVGLVARLPHDQVNWRFALRSLEADVVAWDGATTPPVETLDGWIVVRDAFLATAQLPRLLGHLRAPVLLVSAQPRATLHALHTLPQPIIVTTLGAACQSLPLQLALLGAMTAGQLCFPPAGHTPHRSGREERAC